MGIYVDLEEEKDDDREKDDNEEEAEEEVMDEMTDIVIEISFCTDDDDDDDDEEDDFNWIARSRTEEVGRALVKRRVSKKYGQKKSSKIIFICQKSLISGY